MCPWPWFTFSLWLWLISLTSKYWRHHSRELRADIKNWDVKILNSISSQPSGSRCWRITASTSISTVARWFSALICAFVRAKRDKPDAHWEYVHYTLASHHKFPCSQSNRLRNQTVCSSEQAWCEFPLKEYNGWMQNNMQISDNAVNKQCS